MKTVVQQMIEEIDNQQKRYIDLAKKDKKLSKGVDAILTATTLLKMKVKELLEAEKEQMINFHIEVMKEGLIEEGDKKWSDGYLPKISKTAEQYYTKTFKSDE